MNATVVAVTFMVLAWMVARNRRSSTAEATVMFMAGLLFWSSGIGRLLWIVTDGIWQQAHTDQGTPVVLALIFLGLAFVVTRNRRSSSAESAVMFLGGLFFWSSGIGVALWAVVDGLWHLMGGGHK